MSLHSGCSISPPDVFKSFHSPALEGPTDVSFKYTRKRQNILPTGSLFSSSLIYSPCLFTLLSFSLSRFQHISSFRLMCLCGCAVVVAVHGQSRGHSPSLFHSNGVFRTAHSACVGATARCMFWTVCIQQQSDRPTLLLSAGLSERGKSVFRKQKTSRPAVVA